jgi:hypothetical protein
VELSFTRMVYNDTIIPVATTTLRYDWEKSGITYEEFRTDITHPTDFLSTRYRREAGETEIDTSTTSTLYPGLRIPSLHITPTLLPIISTQL